jgi:hypothetical protein
MALGGKAVHKLDLMEAAHRFRLAGSIVRAMSAAICPAVRTCSAKSPIPSPEEHNADPKPLAWTATPAAIVAKLDHTNASLR